MWKKEIIVINGSEIYFSMKVFENGSSYGIDEGRISKLSCRREGKEVINYDRGWDIRPKENIDKEALEEILKLYN
jgi:hypothetical protein